MVKIRPRTKAITVTNALKWRAMVKSLQVGATFYLKLAQRVKTPAEENWFLNLSNNLSIAKRELKQAIKRVEDAGIKTPSLK